MRFRLSVSTLLILIFTLPSRAIQTNQTNQTNQTRDEKPIINIGALLWKAQLLDSFGYNRSVHLAKSLVENSTRFKTLTDRYQLNLVIEDTFGIPGWAISKAYQITQSNPIPTAVIGPALSSLLDYVATTVNIIACLLVPYTTKIVEDPQKTSFVMSASSGIPQEIAARMAFMKRFNWKRAAVIYDKRNQYLVTFADKIFDQLKKNSVNLTGSAAIEIRVSHGYVDNPIGLLRTKLLSLKKADTKIYFAEIDPYSALVLFCQVYLLNMYGPDFVW
ncbi:uncharacterized protein LOC116287638, partial [Actinia tenebrosa]|uniref:Uncharacterized protein LOC116287638 n=1 Tax=Actinia tenebrosa TaxID=6105 RepID=A0A6P8H3L5_ACTTE